MKPTKLQSASNTQAHALTPQFIWETSFLECKLETTELNNNLCSLCTFKIKAGFFSCVFVLLFSWNPQIMRKRWPSVSKTDVIISNTQKAI